MDSRQSPRCALRIDGPSDAKSIVFTTPIFGHAHGNPEGSPSSNSGRDAQRAGDLRPTGGPVGRPCPEARPRPAFGGTGHSRGGEESC